MNCCYGVGRVFTTTRSVYLLERVFASGKDKKIMTKLKFHLLSIDKRRVVSTIRRLRDKNHSGCRAKPNAAQSKKTTKLMVLQCETSIDDDWNCDCFVYCRKLALR